MYCPSCGVRNDEAGVKFCRGCGDDLRIVSKAMDKSLPLVIATGLGEVLGDERRSEVRQDALILFFGICLLLITLLPASLSQGFAAYASAFVAGYLIIKGGRGVLRYKRSLTGAGRQGVGTGQESLSILEPHATPAVKFPPARETSELSPRNYPSAPPSVTDQTTRRLGSNKTGQE
jgi:hypothetical protein